MGKRILIIENDPEMQSTMEMVLQVADHEVESLEDDRELDDILQRNSTYDLLICDMSSLSRTADAFIDMINDKDEKMPVMAILEYGAQSRIDGLNGGRPVEFIMKPFKSKELLASAEKLWHSYTSSIPESSGGDLK
jgi:DNA-binding NtrC family response regulator